MLSEKQKMLSGQYYHAGDVELVAERIQARLLTKQFNDTTEVQTALRQQLLQSLIPQQGKNLWIEPPFFCDYGYNIVAGDKVYFNFNCVLLDVMPINIGHNTLIGPGVHIYTATHPLNWKERSAGDEFAKPVSIGNDVWIGGGAIICPGVRIGHRCVIGAGSVVTRNIPDDAVAAGNPCRVIRQLEQ
jgi:maltose O-acetyltransferase